MGRLIPTTGPERHVEPDDGTYFTLAELYRHTGCDMVQMVLLPDGRAMWADEEAYHRAVQPPTNERASRIYAEAGGPPGWLVLGDVLITEAGEVEP